MSLKRIITVSFCLLCIQTYGQVKPIVKSILKPNLTTIQLGKAFTNILLESNKLAIKDSLFDVQKTTCFEVLDKAILKKIMANNLNRYNSESEQLQVPLNKVILNATPLFYEKASEIMKQFAPYADTVKLLNSSQDITSNFIETRKMELKKQAILILDEAIAANELGSSYLDNFASYGKKFTIAEKNISISESIADFLINAFKRNLNKAEIKIKGNIKATKNEILISTFNN
jgi:hypothetical protein